MTQRDSAVLATTGPRSTRSWQRAPTPTIASDHATHLGLMTRLWTENPHLDLTDVVLLACAITTPAST